VLLAISFTLGALYGWRAATVRGGDQLDRLQWAAVHGIVFTLAALALSILAARLGWI